MFSENYRVEATPRVDDWNSEYVKSTGELKIFSEKVKINATPRVDDYNQDYIKSGGKVKVIYLN